MLDCSCSLDFGRTLSPSSALCRRHTLKRKRRKKKTDTMGFFDFNIPYNESDRHITAANKAKLKAHRLKLVIKIAELGYTGVAYNRVIKGVMSESDRCSISVFPLSSLLKIAPTLSNSVKFHRELLNVPVSTPFRQYTRLTVVIESQAQAAALNSGNPILKSYDIVAVRPMNQNSFEQACQTSEVDVIAIDFTERLPFRLKQPMVKAAIERGVYFEITYSGLIMDAQVRRQMISNAKLLVEWINGKNLIVSSAAPSASEIRGPYDVANLLSLFGFKSEHAKASVSKNCRYVIAKSLRKKHYFKEAIKVDLIPSGGQSNTNEVPVDDWLNWDPISSGEGDLLLDDITKSFSASDNLRKPVNVLQFASALETLPSHGFQVKDIIPGIDTISERSNGAKNFFNVGGTGVAVDTKGISEKSLEHDLLHKEGKASSLMRQEDSAISPSHEEPKNVENIIDVEEMEAHVDMNVVSERSCALDLLHKVQTEDSAMTDTCDNDSVLVVEENQCCVVSDQELRSEEPNACPCPPGTSLPFPNRLTSFDSNVSIREYSTIDNSGASDAQRKVSVHLEDSPETLITPGESEIPARSFDGHAVSVPMEEDSSGLMGYGEKLSFMLPDDPLNQDFRVMNSEKLGDSVAPADDSQVRVSVDNIQQDNRFLNVESESRLKHVTEEQEKIKGSHLVAGEDTPLESTSGKSQRKRKASYKPFLSPFKNLLISKRSRKKIRYLNVLNSV